MHTHLNPAQDNQTEGQKQSTMVAFRSGQCCRILQLPSTQKKAVYAGYGTGLALEVGALINFLVGGPLLISQAVGGAGFAVIVGSAGFSYYKLRQATQQRRAAAAAPTESYAHL